MITEYQTNNTLNPLLWDGDSLKPELRKHFLNIAKHFVEFLELDVNVKDVILIGSNANYNWSDYSDIDLHVVINFKSINDSVPLVTNYMLAKKSIWNTNYPLKYKNIPIELYAQDENEALNSSVGVFSLTKNKWLNKPNSEQVSVDDDAIKSKAQPYEYEINQLKSTDRKLTYKVKNILLRLKNLRKAGLGNQGEYSIENLAYKYLRNQGYIDKLKTMAQQSTMQSMMIPECAELTNHVSGAKLLDGNEWAVVIKKYDAVVDPRGQWDHPGKCTMIPTHDGSITMQGVGYPVFGTDETGHSILMQPNQTYQYPGKNIFEIPYTAQYQTLLIQLQNAIKNGTRYE
jgi:hypothetical protein